MTKSSRTEDDERAARLVRVARRAVGHAEDDDTPLTAEEDAVIAQIKAEHRRPTREELRDMAKALARKR